MQTPPNSVEAERAALGSVLIKPLTVVVLQSQLRTDDFFLPVHREIFEAMLALAARRVPIDVVSVGDEMRTRGTLGRLDGGMAGLLSLVNETPTAENVDHYVRTVWQKARLRQVIMACDEVRGQAYGDVGDPDQFLAEAVGRIGAIRAASGARGETLHETIDKILDDIDAEASGGGGGPVVPTGIAKLDHRLGGGLGEEWLVAVEAPPSMGKTSWAIHLCVRAAQIGIPVLIHSLEQSRRELATKIMALAAKVGTAGFKYATLDRKAVIAGAAAARKIADLITIETNPNIGHVVMSTTAWRARHDGRALAFVDYLQKLRGFRMRGMSKEEEITGNAEALKQLAKENRIPVVAAVAVDNDASKEKRAARLGDARGSKAIEYEADVVLAIHRERLSHRGPVELILLKNRGGEVGKVTATWVGAYQGFEEPEPGASGDNQDEESWQ